MAEDFTFGDPGQLPRDRAAEFTAAIRARPGEWAIYLDSAAASMSTEINYGRARGFTPVGHYQATSRRNHVEGDPRRRYTIWVRYVGPPEEEDVT